MHKVKNKNASPVFWLLLEEKNLSINKKNLTHASGFNAHEILRVGMLNKRSRFRSPLSFPACDVIELLCR